MLGAVVLAGGGARRMAGVDKAALEVGGVRLLDRVLAAARPLCDRLVVVGPVRPTTVADVRFRREMPAGGGPVPAVSAGLDAVAGCGVVVILAGDLPLLRADDLWRLVAALGEDPSREAAAAAGPKGPNPLLAAYRDTSLRRRLAGLGPGSPATGLLSPPPATVNVELGSAALNVNHPEDLVAAELALGFRRPEGPS